MSVLKTYGSDMTSFKPSLTYQLKSNGHIEGRIDGRAAVEQAIDLMLSTERFAYSIYSPDYGAELAELIGARRELVLGDIERRITEALAEDDRIIGVDDFQISFDRECANISFTARTSFGDIDVERTVKLG